VIQFLQQYYYTPVLFFAALGITLIAGISHYHSLRKTKLFFYYAVISLLQSIISLLILLVNPQSQRQDYIIEITLNIFQFLEFSLFSFYFWNTLMIEKAKRYVLVSSSLLLLLEASRWIFFDGFTQSTDVFTVIESIYFITISLYSLYEYFIYPPSISLVRIPNFWFSTGILLFFSLLIPVFVMKKFISLFSIPIYISIYSVTFIAYSLLFLCIAKGFKWNLTTSKY
jgi:hypothetical protein